MTKKLTTFQEWYDDNEVNGIATVDLKYRVDISSEVEGSLNEDTEDALEKEGLFVIPYQNVEWENKDFFIDITIEVALKLLPNGKIEAFVNSVEAGYRL
jgi:hypothetical protein